MADMIAFFNEQVAGYADLTRKKQTSVAVEDFINNDTKKIKWSDKLQTALSKCRGGEYLSAKIRVSLYRPFSKQYLYLDPLFTERPGKADDIFPDDDAENMVICVTGAGASKEFSVLIAANPPNLHFHHTGQCFPLYTYQSPEPKPVELSLGDAEQDGRRLNVSDFALKAYRAAYKDAKLGKEDIFYYVYGILHSPEYKTRFAADLTKMLPRIPLAEDFWAFSQAGRKLAEIHLNYEDAKPYPVKEHRDVLELKDEKLYVVEKMRFGKKDKETDKTTIQYNSHITLTGIPLAAYDYVVNGKPAIEWIMDRYQFSKDKDSQIVNDPNDWAREHDDPKYILNLLKSIITVSLETMKVVEGLPGLRERK